MFLSKLHPSFATLVYTNDLVDKLIAIVFYYHASVQYIQLGHLIAAPPGRRGNSGEPRAREEEHRTGSSVVLGHKLHPLFDAA